MICCRCNREFNPTKNSTKLFESDGLCGKCRSKKKYLNNVDLYRKTNKCIDCGKTILNVSLRCKHCSQIGKLNPIYKDGYSIKIHKCLCGEVISSRAKLCKECHYKTLSGDTNPNYKHGHYIIEFMNSSEYKVWRKSVYTRDEFKCVLCGSIHNLEAHHIKPKRDFPELVFDINNGITLCKICHAKTYKKEDNFTDLFNHLANLKNSVNSVNPEMGIPNQATTVEGVTTRDEINFPTSAGQPLN